MKKIATLLILNFFLSTHCFSQAGVLDSTFDQDGLAVVDSTNCYENFDDLIVTANGDLILVGSSIKLSEGYDVLIVKLDKYGLPVSSFGNNGIIKIDYAGLNDFAYSIEPVTGAKFLVAGHVGVTSGIYTAALWQFSEDGILDSSFGTNGFEIYDFGQDGSSFSDIKLGSDGRIYGTGYSAIGIVPTFVTCRILTDGILDTTFGNGGIVISDLPGSEQGTFEVHLQDSLVVVSANVNSGGFNADFAVMRFLADGTPDSTFKGTGYVITDFNNQSIDQLGGSDLQADGKIVLGGGTGYLGQPDVALVVRYLTDGNIDTQFGNNGFVVLENPNGVDPFYCRDIFIQPDGKILVACVQQTGSNSAISVYRLLDNGVIDSAFGINGFASSNYYVGGWPYVCNMQTDGKILIAGRCDTGPTYAGLVARFFSGLETAISDPPIENISCHIFPNPASNEIYIQLNSPQHIRINLELVDSQGKKADIIKRNWLAGGNEVVEYRIPNKILPGQYFVIAKQDGLNICSSRLVIVQ